MSYDNQKPKKIDEELRQEDDAFYGDQAEGGHEQALDTDDSVNQAVQDTFGKVPQSSNYNLQTPPEPNIPEDVDSEDIDAKAGLSENMVESTEDPFDTISDADIKRNK